MLSVIQERGFHFIDVLGELNASSIESVSVCRATKNALTQGSGFVRALAYWDRLSNWGVGAIHELPYLRMSIFLVAVKSSASNV